MPPGQGDEQAGGIMIPMKAWIERYSYNVGIPTEAEDAHIPIPVFRFDFDHSRSITQTSYIDPYSSRSVTISDRLVPFSHDLARNL